MLYYLIFVPIVICVIHGLEAMLIFILDQRPSSRRRHNLQSFLDHIGNHLKPKSQQISDRIFGSMKQTLMSNSLEEMSNFADHVCIYNAINYRFLKDQVDIIKSNPPQFDKWNNVSLGNMAYLSLYGHPEFRQDFLNHLKRYMVETNTQLRFNL